MKEVLTINEMDLNVKMYNGQRVVTFKDIDMVHNRPEGTAGRNFRANREHFLENEDYYKVSSDEIRRDNIMDVSDKSHQDIVLITEYGYLMIVKSFTDDLAWKVQRDLIKGYFKLKEVANQLAEELPVNIQSVNTIVQELSHNFGVMCQQVNSMENVLDYQCEAFKKVMESMTLSTSQQELILRTARNRVNYLLGGAHSDLYKKMGRTYLSNLWNNFKSSLHCGSSYKDLNPNSFDLAIDFINSWTYEER